MTDVLKSTYTLNPCPLCGGEAQQLPPEKPNQIVIGCKPCNLKLSGRWARALTAGELIAILAARWNHRESLAALPSAGE